MTEANETPTALPPGVAAAGARRAPPEFNLVRVACGDQSA